jgi:hypothetical protein
VLSHIQSLRKKGDSAYTQVYNEAPDIQKLRHKDEMLLGSQLTRNAERCQHNTESKRWEWEASRHKAIDPVRQISAEDLVNLRLYDKCHQQSLVYMQKHHVLNNSNESPLSHPPIPYLPKLDNPSEIFVNPCLTIEILLGITPPHEFKGLQSRLGEYFSGRWKGIYHVSPLTCENQPRN